MPGGFSIMPRSGGKKRGRSGTIGGSEKPSKIKKNFISRESLAIVLLLAVLGGAHFGLKSWTDSSSSKTQIIQDETTNFLSEINSLEGFEYASAFAYQAKGMRYILNNEKRPSHFFEKLEQSVHSGVYIKQLSLNISDDSLSLTGSAPDLETAAQQYIYWRDSAEWIKEVNLQRLDETQDKDKSGVSFSVTIKFDPQILKI